MTCELFEAFSEINCSREDLFHWHERPGAFERLCPPWERLVIVSRSGGIRNGDRVTLRIPWGPCSIPWQLEHRDFIEFQQFKDVQVSGPFRSYSHLHRFELTDSSHSSLRDRIEYSLPLQALSKHCVGGYIRRKLGRLFRYRHSVLRSDLEAHRRYQHTPRLSILISGASGLVGSALIPYLTSAGHRIKSLVRRPTTVGADSITWDPEARVQFPTLTGVDAVVHLAGEPIAGGRWSSRRKKQIRESRVRGTTTLCEALLSLTPRPKVLVCASAIGFYGSRGNEILTEESKLGSGFLADVSNEWEQATEIARAAGIRVVNLRFGIVLSPRGGALKKMLPLFRCGLGGTLGSGSQWMSWISIDDVVGLVEHALCSDAVHGPLNAVSPVAVTNSGFTLTLASVLRRPARVPVPAWALRLATGELADEALLASTRVLPAKATETGYLFRHPELLGALQHLLGR